MLTYGSQVNPALLRQDFSSILQGAQAQAQGITQAAQTRAQMMANIGSQISEGFKTYVKNREQNSVLDGRIGRILSSRPELANDPELKPLFDERAKKGGLPLDKSQKLFSALETTLELDKAKQEQDARALQMRANQFQLDEAIAAKSRADNDRRAYANVFNQASKLGRLPTQEELFKLGLFENMSPEALASITNLSQNSAEFGLKMRQYAEQIDKLKNENTEAAARTERIRAFSASMPNGFRVINDGSNQVFQYIDYANGQLKSEPLKSGQTPASIQLLGEKQKQTQEVFDKYTALLNSPDRDSPENIAKRNALTERYNVINPKSDLQFNQTRSGLDALWGIKPVIGGTEKPGSAAKPPPPTPSNIRGVSAAAPGAQPTPAAAPAAAVPTAAAAQGGFNLIEDMRRTFAGRAQAAPVTTPAVDTTVATPTPAAPPPVDLSAPPSIAAAVRFGDAPPPNPTPAVERALKSAMRWADKNLGPKGKLGLGALAESLSKPAFEAAREQELRLAQELSEKSDTPVKTFNEAMTNFGYRKSGGGQWEYKGPTFRAGTGSGSEETWMRGRIPDALIPSFLNPSPGTDFGGAQPAASAAGGGFEPNVFARAGMALYNSLPSRTQESRFLDREARATVAAMRPEMETPLPFERYQTPNQGPVPQIKLSPAAQKIASELRRSAQSGERGKAPQFFLEASTGDDGKRTRIKLSKQDLDLFLSRTPDLRGEVRMGAEFQPFSQSYGQQLRQFRAR